MPSRISDAERARRALEIEEGWDRMRDDKSITTMAEFCRRMGFNWPNWVRKHAPDTYREILAVIKENKRTWKALEIAAAWDEVRDDESIRSVAEFSRRMGFMVQKWVENNGPDTHRKMCVVFKERLASTGLLTDAERTQRASEIAAAWDGMRADLSIRSFADFHGRMGFRSHNWVELHAPDTYREMDIAFREREIAALGEDDKGYSKRRSEPRGASLSDAARTRRTLAIAAAWDDVRDDESIISMAEFNRRMGYLDDQWVKHHAPDTYCEIRDVLKERSGGKRGRHGRLSRRLSATERAQRAVEIAAAWDGMRDDGSIRSFSEFNRRMGFLSQSWVKIHAPDTHREMTVVFKEREAGRRREKAKQASQRRHAKRERRRNQTTQRTPLARGRQRIEFADLPDESPDLAVRLAPLHATIDFQDGRDLYEIDWRDLPHNTKLARDFMGSLLDVCGPDKQRTTRSDCGGVKRSTHGFLIWLPGAVRCAGDLTPDLFSDWEAHLRENHSPGDARDRLRAVLFLLRQKPLLVELSDDMKDRTEYVSHHKKPRPTPRNAYSPYVARQIRDSTKRAMGTVLTRMTDEVAELLAAGIDPRGLGPPGRGRATATSQYRDVSNALKVLEAVGPVSWHEFCAEIGSVTQVYLKQWKTSFNDDPEKGRTSFADLRSMLYPAPSDLAPFLLRLVLDTGIPPSSAEGLRVDCIPFEKTGNETTITWDKPRVHRTQAMSFADLNNVKGRDGNFTSPGGLIRTVRQLTKRLRDTLPDGHADKTALFLVRGIVGVGQLSWMTSQALKKSVTAALGLSDDDDEPLAIVNLGMLRKTASLESDSRHGGDAAYRMGHSEPTHRRHYEAPPAAQSDLRSQVIGAQTGAVDLLRVTPSVVVDVDATEPVPATSVDKGISLPVVQNVFVANCKGFTSSPFAKRGVPCPKAVWNCLGCDRAVITSDHLPWLLCLLETMKRERQYMGESAFHHKFGEAHDVLTLGILPRFPETLIRRSSIIAKDINPSSFLPLEMRANHEAAHV
jgi:hypothetical protein